MTDEAPSSLEAFLKGAATRTTPEPPLHPPPRQPSGPAYPVPAPRQPLGSFLASLKGDEEPPVEAPSSDAVFAAPPAASPHFATAAPSGEQPAGIPTPTDIEDVLPDPEPQPAPSPVSSAEALPPEPPKIRFRRFWDARNAVASTVLAEAAQPPPGSSAQALAEFDTALAGETARLAIEGWDRGGRFVLMLPVHQTTLLRHRLRIPYVDAWLAQPDAVRRITRFCVTGLDETVSRAELVDMAGMLNRLGRPPVLAPPLKSTHITRAGGIGIFGILYDRTAASEAERAWFDERSAAIMRRGVALGLKLLMGGITESGPARSAIGDGVEFLEMPGRADPAQPADPLAPDAYLKLLDESS